jgi:hypothetical protein
MNQLQSKQNKQDSTKNPTQQTGQSFRFSKPAVHPYLHAQAIIGNHGILRRHSNDIIHAKFKIGQSNDKYEQEADRIADQVMRMPEPSIQRKPPCPECMKEDEELIQTKQTNNQTPTVTSNIESGINSLKGSGQPLPETARSFFESRFGTDFSQVRLHTDSKAAETAKSVNANAFTIGKNVVFGANQYSPMTFEGKHLLAHELSHVVQQGQGVQGNSKNEMALTPAPISSPRIQLQRRRGAAGGCGICLDDPRGLIAGGIAHKEIQFAFHALYNDLRWEEPVTVVPGDETKPFEPSLDLAYEEENHFGRTIHIGEIKPLDDAGRQRGAAERQLRDYARELRASLSFDEVFRMRLPPPPGPYPFFNPMNPPGCPAQVIHVQRTAPGVYQYYCEPPWSQLKRNPSCNDCTPRTPVPLQQPQEHEVQERERERQPELEPGMRPVPVTPRSTLDQIIDFSRRVIETGVDAEQAAEEFLQENPGIAWTILALGTVGIIALVADDATLAGIADDVLIPINATLMRVAWRFAF